MNNGDGTYSLIYMGGTAPDDPPMELVDDNHLLWHSDSGGTVEYDRVVGASPTCNSEACES